MNRKRPTWTVTEEDGDQMCILYKGKQFRMPRSEYTRKLTAEDHKPVGLASDIPEKVRAEYSFGSSYLRCHKTDPTETKQIETKFFNKFMDDSNSMETVVERNLPMLSSSDCANTQEPKLKITVSSAESVNSRKSQETVETLSELKGRLVSIIDKTIYQLESQQDLAERESRDSGPMYPGGDGSSVAHRVQNFQLLKTDSFTQTKREVRLKLFTEIETIVMRLKDMEKLN
ncbi:uncharacterized protein LOC129764408 isoform X2 [Toxorhynchites rutilus septentrionalis]|uniref:uncharacterized protein LOC129764408 isoform X2 n=1 Tax=Toxorhynchites rutilus septentrionalis TaxID=329112 RepID=UPI00247AC36D|nr:uncharacterized protein LOC129764408 isoform X2 [Toxorhynchites rutilus septentrionalis]